MVYAWSAFVCSDLIVLHSVLCALLLHLDVSLIKKIFQHLTFWLVYRILLVRENDTAESQLSYLSEAP